MAAPRRAFLKSLAVAPLLPAGMAEAAPASKAKPKPAPSPTPAPPPPSPAPTTPADPRVEAFARLVEVRHGGHLQPGDLDAVKAGIADNLKAADQLHAVALGNADEPVLLFTAAPPPRS